MEFNQRPQLEGCHAPFSPSQSAWLRYNDEKLIEVYRNKKASEHGTRLHAWAKETIDLRIKQPRSKKTLCSYVNDAIGFNMQTEVLLFYSERFFGTADAICFRNNVLRIHDLKTGKTPCHIEQLMVYAALFCLEYKIKPSTIDIELRIYQNNEVFLSTPSGEEIFLLMEHIKHCDSLLSKIDSEEV